ncbi:hypothetical protein [Bartonella kosoyi]|uniref:hypothetical protein n=1 Tax=Bartonella kosoyi TaxID=2133959 RepID=UPI0014255323|nr:hypothetical protein [Bartonella kosoyi]
MWRLGGGVWFFAIVWNGERGLGSEEFVNGGTSCRVERYVEGADGKGGEREGMRNRG